MVIQSSGIKSLFVFGITLCLVLVCGLILGLGQPSLAHSTLEAQVDIAGSNITGTLVLSEKGNGLVQIRGTVQGDPATLTPGLHGLHIHGVGVCDPNVSPAFTTAGGHFDPGPFGSELPVEANHPYHLGDLPNLVVDEQGYAKYHVLTSRVTLSEGPVSLFDNNNGKAIIIHQLPDQQKSGGLAADAGGGRLACGVVTRL